MVAVIGPLVISGTAGAVTAGTGTAVVAGTVAAKAVKGALVWKILAGVGAGAAGVGAVVAVVATGGVAATIEEPNLDLVHPSENDLLGGISEFSI